MIEVDRDALEALRVHGEAGYPNEVCGLLLGTSARAGDPSVSAVLRARNLEPAADHYMLDPRDFLQAEHETRTRRLEIVGVYHSHPDHPPIPSETDRVRAAEVWNEGESWSYLILEVVQGRLRSWRSWVLRGGAFHDQGVRSPGLEA